MKIKKKNQDHDHIVKNQIKQTKKNTSGVRKKSPSKIKNKQVSSTKFGIISSLESNYLSSYPNKSSNLYYGKKYRDIQTNPKKQIDSNQSSTHCSFNNRSIKQKSFQHKKSHIQNKLQKSTKLINEYNQNNYIEEEQLPMKLNSNQIMQLINNYAIKIQRQWRRYWFRKCLRFLIFKQRERKKYELLNSFYENHYEIGNQGTNKNDKKRLSQNLGKRNSKMKMLNQQESEFLNKKRYTLPKLPKRVNQFDIDNNSESRQKNQGSDLKSKQQVIETENLQESQVGKSYNNKKYFSSLSEINSKNYIQSNSNILSTNKNNQNHQRTSSLGQNIQKIEIQSRNRLQKANSKKIDIAINCSLSNDIEQQKNNTLLCTPITPINQLRSLTQSSDNKQSEKKSNIKINTNVISCVIADETKKKVQMKNIPTSMTSLKEQNLQTPKDKFRSNQNKIMQKTPNNYSKKQYLHEQKSKQLIRQRQSPLKNYQTKFSPIQKGYQIQNVSKIFKKCKNALKQKSSKNLKSLQQKYKQKQITQRTYKKLLKETTDKYSTQIKSLQIKQGSFKNSFNELYVMFKEYLKENSFQYTGEVDFNGLRVESSNIMNKNVLQQKQFEQHSISLDKWDFETSAKKSISQLQSFQQFAKELNQRNPQKIKGFYFEHKLNYHHPNHDNKTIELVLDQLDKLDQDTKQRKSGFQLHNDQNRVQNLFNKRQRNFKQLIREQAQLSDGNRYKGNTDSTNQLNKQLKQPSNNNNFSKKLDFQMVQTLKNKSQQFQTMTQKIKTPKTQTVTITNQLFIPKQFNHQTIKNYQNQKTKQKSFQKYIQNYKKQQQNQRQKEKEKEKYFQYPKIQTNSIQSLEQIRFFSNFNSPNKNFQENLHVPTEQSEDSQVEMKITSIHIEDDKGLSDKNGRNNNKNQAEKDLFANIQIQVIKTQEYEISEQDKLLQQKRNKQIQLKRQKQLTIQSQKFIKNLSIKLFSHNKVKQLPPVIKLLSQILTKLHQQKQYKKQLQQRELRKYPATIQPNIDNINNWLLEISHHLLDHHNFQIRNNLINVRQIPNHEMLEICKDQKKAYNFYQCHSYLTISEKMFKEFQFFYIKSMAGSLEIQEHHLSTFQYLLYAFHRNLIDSLNITLLDELSIGKNWVVLPWVNSFRYKKKQAFQHAKQCLQRAINRVSSWGQYCMGQMTPTQQISEFDWKQYQQQKMNLVVRQQVLQYSIQNDFFLTNLIFKLYESIYQDQMKSACSQILKLTQKQK